MTWHEQIRQGYRSIEPLRELLSISNDEARKLEEVTQRYPMLVNTYYASLIDWDDPDDPIRRLSIPSVEEASPNGAADTSGELSNTVLPGLQHKYRQTALILSTNECAMYCRHCFRKRMVGASDSEVAHNLNDMRDYIVNHPEINNVLISGGDAFLNSNARLQEFLEAFCSLPQLDFVRLGTRTPVVLPQRITEDEQLQDLLAFYSQRKQLYVVTQFDHPNEITSEAAAAINRLKLAGIIVRNQTVLLKGINDNPIVLATLLRKLTACGVVPYYVFQCRPTRGVLNLFEVPLISGARIVDEARQLQNGQGKGIRYVMSHPTGKIEILGITEGDEMLFKYHEAKHAPDENRIFTRTLAPDQGWL